MRRATGDTVAEMIPVVAAAFGETFTDAEIELELKTWEVDRIFGAFDGDRTVGMCGIYTFRLTTPGGEVPAAGFTLVGVLPGERRRGILTTMMREMIADARARGEPVAVLWASEGAIYQRYGFGLGSFCGSFELARGQAAFARAAEPVGRVRLVTEAEALALIPPIYEKVRPGTPGLLSRREAWWQWGTLADPEHARQAAGPKFRVVHEVDGTVDGYAIYRTKAEWDCAARRAR